METLLGALAFTAFILAQVAAVVAVHAERRHAVAELVGDQAARPRERRAVLDGRRRADDALQAVARGVPAGPGVGLREPGRAIARLGYVPNPAARSLVTRRSESVGVVITEPTSRLFNEPFFPRLLRGISGELAARQPQLAWAPRLDLSTRSSLLSV